MYHQRIDTSRMGDDFDPDGAFVGIEETDVARLVGRYG